MAKIPKKIIDITTSQSVGNVGLPVNDFTGGSLLTAADFVTIVGNKTTLYGWHAPTTDSATWTDLGDNAKALTRNGALDVSTDMLGNSVANYFDGVNDYLNSADAAFAFTGSFSFGMWVYRDDWNNVSGGQVLMSRYGGTNGWELNWRFASPNNLTFHTFNSSVETVGVEVAKPILTPGWHYIVIVRDTASVFTKLYIDGVLYSRASVATAFTASGTALEIGSENGGTYKFKEKMQDIWVHNATVWTDAQVWSLYQKAAPAYKLQQFAGHELTVTDPNRISSEVLALYKFNNGLLTTDETGSYTLTNVNTVVDAGGIFGGYFNSAYFNGSSNYFTQPILLDSVPSAIAIGFWFKTIDGQPTTGNMLFCKVNDETGSSNDRIFLQTRSTGTLYLIANSNSGTSKTLESQTILPNGITSWYHVVVNWDIINGLRLFVNGILEASDSSATSLMTNGTTRDFIIGAYNEGGSIANYFNGWIDEFIVMNKVLTQADVDILYSQKIAIPSTLQTRDYSIEAVIQPKGVSTFETKRSGESLIVARDSSYLYRAGYTDGQGLTPGDKQKFKGRL